MRKISFIMILIGVFLVCRAPIGGESFYQDTEISQEQLDEILKKCAEYCEKLSYSVLDFICIEKVSEEINTLVERRRNIVAEYSDGSKLAVGGDRLSTEANKYVYDYQMIRKDNKISDRRILLRENGRKKNEVNAKLKTKRFKHHNLIFGPIALLHSVWQPYYDYKIIQRERFKGDKVTVIEATPKETMKPGSPYGKIWIRDNDFSIVKIEWAQESLPYLKDLEMDADKFKARPEIMVYAEYGFEKNGIRFPNKYTIIEDYYRKSGKYFTRSRMYVTYNGYKFFSVSSDVKYFGPPF